MATFKEQSAEILDRYLDEVTNQPVSLDDVADWALGNGLFTPRPQDIRKICRDAIAEGARSQKRFDGKRWYRAKHAVKTSIGGIQLNLWADIDKNASHSFMSKSISQRRRSIADDCYSLKMDSDHYSEANPQLDPIQPVLDFTDDVAEREAAEMSPNSSEPRAA
ncbi:hypothetical protein J2800_001330 [Caulobacter rhizosphaerae]|jgi:hypothetical protein|uniref:Uncharacterized protein n=1 Tax=Caulobacter rhizosphaerae TaxID=2010972 RepID=A0ABU1MWN4_9CAUL|nr:hypothetical protein [Caulobacter rhizosphaerae]MDR6530594.1 hypothetical protein [Caulobacter rhizosphaerae]